MAIKIGINGFGRIGRVVLRILAEQPDKYEVCGINLRKADVDYMVYLLKYDSVFRRFNGTVEHEAATWWSTATRSGCSASPTRP